MFYSRDKSNILRPAFIYLFVSSELYLLGRIWRHLSKNFMCFGFRKSSFSSAIAFVVFKAEEFKRNLAWSTCYFPDSDESFAYSPTNPTSYKKARYVTIFFLLVKIFNKGSGYFRQTPYIDTCMLIPLVGMRGSREGWGKCLDPLLDKIQIFQNVRL